MNIAVNFIYFHCSTHIEYIYECISFLGVNNLTWYHSIINDLYFLGLQNSETCES